MEVTAENITILLDKLVKLKRTEIRKKKAGNLIGKSFNPAKLNDLSYDIEDIIEYGYFTKRSEYTIKIIQNINSKYL